MPIKVKVNVIKAVTIGIPKDTHVFADKKSGVKSASFQFSFADGQQGFLTITRIFKDPLAVGQTKQPPWNPAADIKEINIKFDD